jgi:hypothetical protein
MRSVDPRRVPDWGWTIVLTVATALAFGLLFAIGPAGPAGSFAFPGVTIAVGLGAGLLAHRGADLLGVVAGTVLAFEVLAAVEVAQHGGFPGTITMMLGIALVPGVFAAAVGGIVLGIRRTVGGRGIPAMLWRGAAILAVFVGFAGLYVLATSRPAAANSYRVIGERDLVITVTGGNATWCRITSATETQADVTVGAACVSLILGPTTAVGIPTDLAVHLAQPLGARIVRNEGGGVVPQAPRTPPPSARVWPA